MAEYFATPPSPSKDDLRRRWEARVRQAQQLRGDWELRYRVRALADAYLGHQVDQADGDDIRPWMNHFFATIQTQRPGLLPKEIRFIAYPRVGRKEPVDKITAKVQAAALDAIASQDDQLMTAARLAVTQAFWRLGALKCVYDQRLEPNPQHGDDAQDADGLPLMGENDTAMKEPKEILSDEVYAWHWVDASCLLLPDDGPDPRRWTWLGEEITVTLEEAQDDTRFPARLRKQLKANATTHRREHGERSSYVSLDDDDPRRQDSERLCYYECWDLREKKHYVWADGQDFDDWLLDEPTPDGIEEHPYALLLPVPIIEPSPSPWPMPLTYNWLPLQYEYNQLRQQQLNAARTAARKILYEEGTFPDEDESRKVLSSNIDMEAAMVNDLQRPPLLFGDSVQSPDVARNIPYLMSDWQRITGATGTRLGESDSDTATEAVMMEQAAGLRDAELQGLIQRWLAEAGRKMLQLVRQTLTLDLWVQLSGMSDEHWREFLQSAGLRSFLALRVGQEAVPQVLQMLSANPQLQDELRERFGQLRPFRVTRSELVAEADIAVVPSTIKPVYRAQLLQLAKVLGPMALLSPTLVEEFIKSFDLPYAEQIAEELLTNLQRQGGLAAMRGKSGQAGGQSAASPLGQNGGNPLAAVNTGMGGV